MEQLATAVAFLQNGDYKKAALMAQKALIKIKQTGDVIDIFKALEVRVTAMCASQDFEKATSSIQEVLSQFRQTGQKNGVVLVTCLLADALLSKGDTEGALAHAESAKELAKDERDRTGEAVALRTLGKIHLHMNAMDEAIQCGYRVADIMQECKDPEAQAFDLVSLAEVHSQAGQYEDCVTVVKKAASLFQTVQNKEGEADALRVGADACWAAKVLRRANWKDDYDDGALPMCTKALGLYKAVGNVQGHIAMGSMMGKLQFELQDFDGALSTAEELVPIIRSTDFTKDQLGEMYKLAVESLLCRVAARKSTATQRSLGQWVQKAVEHAQELVGLHRDSVQSEQMESERILASALIAKGEVLKEPSFAVAAAQAAQKSLDVSKELQDPRAEAAACLVRAEIHFASREINPAADLVEKCLEMYKELQDFTGITKAERLLRKFKSSPLWPQRKFKTADGALVSGPEAMALNIPLGGTGYQKAELYIHLDNLRSRSAKNIG
jgi:tetratricopeptide (TPR) repeat protein